MTAAARRLRVLLDASPQLTPTPTGVERAQIGLVEALCEHAADAVVLWAACPGPLPARWRALDAARVTRLEQRARRPWLWRQTRLVALARELDADVVHSPVAAFPVRAPCAVVATVHEVPWIAGVGDRRVSHRAWLGIAARCASRIIVPSARTAAQLVRLAPACGARVDVVPHGMVAPDTHGARAESGDGDAMTAAGVPDAAGAVLAVGVLRRKKNLDALVAGYARLPAALRARHALVLVGRDGGDRARLASLAEQRGVADRVRFTGYVDDAVLEQLYDAAACLVHASWNEGFGFPPLEAMARGVPVVASAQGAVDEVLGDAALRFDAARPETLGAVLARVLGEDDVAEHARVAGRRHAATLSPARWAARVLEVYRAAVAARGAEAVA